MLGVAVLAAGPIVAIAVSAGAQSPPPAQHARPAAVAVAPVSAASAVTVVEHQIVRQLISRAPAPKPAAAPPAQAPPSHQTAAAPVVSYSPSSIEGIIAAAAARWGVSASWMISIARCESGLNPRAVNPSGPYDGLFQFLMSTFRANGGTNIWDPADQANITAKMLAHGQAHQWSCA